MTFVHLSFSSQDLVLLAHPWYPKPLALHEYWLKDKPEKNKIMKCGCTKKDTDPKYFLKHTWNLFGHRYNG